MILCQTARISCSWLLDRQRVSEFGFNPSFSRLWQEASLLSVHWSCESRSILERYITTTLLDRDCREFGTLPIHYSLQLYLRPQNLNTIDNCLVYTTYKTFSHGDHEVLEDMAGGVVGWVVVQLLGYQITNLTMVAECRKRQISAPVYNIVSDRRGL